MRLRGGKNDESKTPSTQTAKRSRRLQGNSPEFKTASPTLLSGRKKAKPKTPAPERTVAASPDVGKKTARVLFEVDTPIKGIIDMDVDAMKYDVNHMGTIKQGVDKPSLTSNKPGGTADASKSSPTRGSSPVASAAQQHTPGVGSPKSQIPSPRVHFASSVTRVKLAPGEPAKSTAASSSLPEQKSTPQSTAAAPSASSNSNNLNVKGKQSTPAAISSSSLPDKKSTPQASAAVPPINTNTNTNTNTQHEASKSTQNQKPTKGTVTPPNMPKTTSPLKDNNTHNTPIKSSKTTNTDAAKQTDSPAQKDGTNTVLHSVSPIKNTKPNNPTSPSLPANPQTSSTPQKTPKGQPSAHVPSTTNAKARTPQPQTTPLKGPSQTKATPTARTPQLQSTPVKGQSQAQATADSANAKARTPQLQTTPVKGQSQAQATTDSANAKARTSHKDDKISENIPIPPLPSDFELALQERVKMGIITQAQADAIFAEEMELINNPEHFKRETEGMTDYLQNEGTREVSL